ncbi:MAG: helix-turn-helix domain-containing protein, partial [Anaerolineae bacterium]|nr:helix-turn-helix domain-containing protein [Anaerolineae bacterium]
MPDNASKSDWVSLRDAADILGVHPATIRNWADKGELPMRRTPGGHRRFRRDDLEAWLETRQSPPPAEVQILIQNAMGRMRMHISDGAMSQFEWYTNMPAEARGVMAQKGRQMLDTLQKFLVDAFDQSSAEHDIQHMGE